MRYQRDYRDDVEEIKSLIVPVSLSSPMNVQSAMNNNSSLGISNNSGGMSSMGSSNNAGITTQPNSQAKMVFHYLQLNKMQLLISRSPN
jgi:hypothetical protein